MKKPNDFKIKKFLCDNTIIGLVIHYKQTGVDTADTYWELIPQEGHRLKVLSRKVESLVNIKPDWIRVLHAKDYVVKEVKNYVKFIKEKEEDFILYKKLKAKFEE